MSDMNPAQVETLGILSEVIADSSFTVLSMLLGKDIDLAPIRSDRIAAEEIEGLDWPTIIVGKGSFTRGVEGSIFFIYNIVDATRLIDLMLGGEGESTTILDEDSTDALNETINQIMGATCQTLSEKTGQSVSIDQVEIQTGQGADVVRERLETDPFPGIEFTMALDELIDSKMFIGLNEKLFGSLTDLFHKPKSEASSEPRPAPEPAATSGGPAAAAPGAPAATVFPPSPQPAPEPAYTGTPGNIDLLMDIELPVVIRIGKTELLLQDILKLTPGAIIELNKTTDDPIDMLVNNKLVARGEVVVVEGNFAFRITEIVSPAARIRSLG